MNLVKLFTFYDDIKARHEDERKPNELEHIFVLAFVNKAIKVLKDDDIEKLPCLDELIVFNNAVYKILNIINYPEKNKVFYKLEEVE